MAVPKVDGQFIAEAIKYIDENGKSKICFNRKSLPMFGGTSSAAGMCRSRIIHDRINLFLLKFRHDLTDHGCSKFQLFFQDGRVPRRIFCEERIAIAFVIPGKPLSKKKIQY